MRVEQHFVALHPEGAASGSPVGGRLGQALKSDTYGDFRLGQLTQVNIVVVSG